MKIVKSLFDSKWRMSLASDHTQFVEESGGILDSDFESELRYHKEQCKGCLDPPRPGRGTVLPDEMRSIAEMLSSKKDKK